MINNYDKIFSYIGSPQPADGLFIKIVNRIDRAKRISSIKRLIMFSLAFVGSAVGFIPALNSLRTALIESGFTQFFSLIFSDFSIVLNSWKVFTLTLLESLPAVDVLIFLVVISVFIGSLRFLIKYGKLSFSHLQLIHN